MRYTEKDHPSHPHKLILVEEPGGYTCDGCKQMGVEPCYQCESCDFHLHEACANGSNDSIHPSSAILRAFSGCRFQFHFNGPEGRERYCDVCGHDVKGFRYQCQHSTGHDLHPCCMKLPKELVDKETGLKIRLREKTKSKCQGCGAYKAANGVKGWSYVDPSDGRLSYHVACIRNLVFERWRQARFGQTAYGLAAAQDTAIVRRGSNTARTWLRRVWFFVRLVVSAVFGDPTGVIAVLVGSLQQ